MIGGKSWRLPIAGALAARDLDGELAVYNRLSGDTHIVDIVTAQVLRAIESGTSREDELCIRVARFLDVPEDESIHRQVGRILRTLDGLGLIEPAGGC